MAVSIAEYLGQRTDTTSPTITPVAPKSGAQCPFMDRHCDKVARGKPPVCSVRGADKRIWIVCEHRLCATSNKNEDKQPINLVAHQIDILWQIASKVYRGTFSKSDIAVKREQKMPLEDSGTSSKADYIMRNLAPGAKVDELLLEMQGGGETSGTGSITDLVKNWSADANRSNTSLASNTKATTNVTNAWRRQQEQFLVKGNVVSQTGGRIAFVVGEPIFDLLQKKLSNTNFRDLRSFNWTLALMAVVEDKSKPVVPGAIPLKISEDKLLFTNYSTFVRSLTDQGGPLPEIFLGDYLNLNNQQIKVKV